MGHLNLPRRIHEPQNKFPKSGDDWVKPHIEIINKSRFKKRTAISNWYESLRGKSLSIIDGNVCIVEDTNNMSNRIGDFLMRPASFPDNS